MAGRAPPQLAEGEMVGRSLTLPQYAVHCRIRRSHAKSPGPSSLPQGADNGQGAWHRTCRLEQQHAAPTPHSHQPLSTLVYAARLLGGTDDAWVPRSGRYDDAKNKPRPSSQHSTSRVRMSQACRQTHAFVSKKFRSARLTIMSLFHRKVQGSSANSMASPLTPMPSFRSSASSCAPSRTIHQPPSRR